MLNVMLRFHEVCTWLSLPRVSVRAFDVAIDATSGLLYDRLERLLYGRSIRGVHLFVDDPIRGKDLGKTALLLYESTLSRAYWYVPVTLYSVYPIILPPAQAGCIRSRLVHRMKVPAKPVGPISEVIDAGNESNEGEVPAFWRRPQGSKKMERRLRA